MENIDIDYRLVEAESYSKAHSELLKQFIENIVKPELWSKYILEGENECMSYDAEYSYSIDGLNYHFYACLLVNINKPSELIIDDFGAIGKAGILIEPVKIN